MSSRLLHISQPRKLLFAETRFSQQNLKMAGNAGKTSTPGIDYPLQNLLGIHKTVIDHEACANSQMGVQERSAEAIVKRQHSHDPIASREVQILHDRFSVRDDVAMRNLDSARFACRSGSEHKGGKIIRLHFG